MPTVGYRPYVRGKRPAPVGGALGIAYDSSAAAYFAAMTVQPDATRKSLLNSLIVGLKSDGVWTSIAYMPIMAAHDAQAGLINIVNPAQIATTSGSPIFTTDRGYQGDNVSASIETGIADSTTAQDSLAIFCYINQNQTVNAGAAMGLSSGAGTRLSTVAPGQPPVGRVHGSSALSSTILTSTGLITYSHTAANANVLYRGGTADVTDTTAASSAPTGSTFTFLRNATGYVDARIAVGGWAVGLNGTQVAALYNRLNTYLTAVGGA